MNRLPENLKYAYLGNDETLLIIISNALTSEQEDKLIRGLREHREELGWTLVDLKDLGHFMFTLNHIELDAKPKRDPQ